MSFKSLTEKFKQINSPSFIETDTVTFTDTPVLSMCRCACYIISIMSDSVTLWTITLQASLSMGFSRQEFWSGLPFPPPGDLLDPEKLNLHLLWPLQCRQILYHWTTEEAQSQCSSVYMLISTTKFIHPSFPPHSPLVTARFFLVCESLFC